MKSVQKYSQMNPVILAVLIAIGSFVAFVKPPGGYENPSPGPTPVPPFFTDECALWIVDLISSSNDVRYLL